MNLIKELLEPWEFINSKNDCFESELYKEITKGHILFNLKAKAIAKRIDCDDVLFELDNNELALVHLTWKMKTEESNEWPRTTIYKCYEDWKRQCMIPNHIEYSSTDKVFTIEKANKRINDEISLFGNGIDLVKPGDYICLETDWYCNFKVKGIENLSFIDKTKNHLNPWIIIETKLLKPEEFIGKKYIVIGICNEN